MGWQKDVPAVLVQGFVTGTHICGPNGARPYRYNYRPCCPTKSRSPSFSLVIQNITFQIIAVVVGRVVLGRVAEGRTGLGPGVCNWNTYLWSGGRRYLCNRPCCLELQPNLDLPPSLGIIQNVRFRYVVVVMDRVVLGRVSEGLTDSLPPGICEWNVCRMVDVSCCLQ